MPEDQSQGEKMVKRGKSKGFKIIFGVILLLVMASMRVGASESNPAQAGRLTIKIPDFGTPKKGTSFAVCKVGEVVNLNTYKFALTGDFVISGVDLNNLATGDQQRSAARTLRGYVMATPLLEETLSEGQAEIVFEGLAQGVYLIYQTNVTEYGSISPFIVFIPHRSLRNSMEYDLVMEPKCEVLVATPSVTPDVTPSESGTSVPNTPTPSKISKILSSTNAKTGDMSTVMPYVVVMVAILVLIIIMVIRKCKRNER